MSAAATSVNLKWGAKVEVVDEVAEELKVVNDDVYELDVIVAKVVGELDVTFGGIRVDDANEG